MLYHRPQSLQEALKLLKRGVPLGGGTALVAQRREFTEVIDLQSLDLTQLSVQGDRLVLGAGLSLQRLLDAPDPIPPILRETIRLEAPRNLREQATLAGTIMAGDGRSPLLTALIALGAQLRLQPGDDQVDLYALSEDRFAGLRRRLITAVELQHAGKAAYAQVARSPADRPIVCAAVSIGRGGVAVGIALGGHGDRALRVAEGERAIEALAHGDGSEPNREAAIDRAASAAGALYATADDAWAGGAYRGEVAGVLIRRLLREVLG